MNLTNAQLEAWRKAMIDIAGARRLLIDDVFESLDRLPTGNGTDAPPVHPAPGSDDEFEAAVVESFIEALETGPEAALRTISFERGKIGSEDRQDKVIRKWIDRLHVSSDGFLDVKTAMKDLEDRLIR